MFSILSFVILKMNCDIRGKQKLQAKTYCTTECMKSLKTVNKRVRINSRKENISGMVNKKHISDGK